MSKTISQKILNRLGDKPAQLAFNLSNTSLMRRQLGRRYNEALASHRPLLPRLEGIDRLIVEGLERDGVFITSLDALGLSGSAEMLRAAQKAASECAEDARREAGAGREFTCAPASATVENPEIFHWGLNDRLLDIAEAYIGLPAAYDGMALIYTVADGTELGPRQWHRDREDRKMIKLAVYCSDVTDRGGPFELISRVDPSQGVDDRYVYEFGTPEVLNERLGADYSRDVVSCTGPVGTVVFADTARFFHRGAPAHDKDRAALFYGYFANSTRHPYFCERSGLKRREIAELVQGMSPRQRASALWQEGLPAWLKLIPPAPI
ncbi:hypothetical protein EDF56_102162 [Novosphingobium sp. PhB165]|uniref:hypothetical protein n=1 Tax=Novosphingobium sp. PhB165 TaxID=2485105 RepID=UPI0010E162A3|nr:hypothetical protein [Novosphingobium sp. PhB165]TCM20501.1 hypothetical protein EDF56_102162 [Novosphingobium sp. PhB165]